MLKPFKSMLCKNDRGVSTVEFAFALPVLIFVLFYGSIEMWRLVSDALRVDRAASHIAGVAARADSTLDEGALTSLLKSANTIASPTNLLSGGRVIISAVEGGPSGKILWQRCLGDKPSFVSELGSTGAVAALTANAMPTPPVGTTALIAETFYEHHFALVGTALPPVSLKHKSISLGREEIPVAVLANGLVSGC